MRMGHGLLVVALVAAMVAAGCGKGDEPTAPGDGPGTTGGGSGITVRNATPKELLETAHEAAGADDIAVMSSLVNPAAAEPFRAMMDLMTEMQTACKEVSATVEAKLGAEHAAKLSQMGEKEGMESPLAKAVGEDGSVDWDRVKITEEGDTARFEIDGKAEDDTLLRKIDGRWYVDFEELPPEQMQKQVDEMRPQVEKMKKVWRDLDAQVKAGTITAENFDEKYMELLTANMSTEE